EEWRPIPGHPGYEASSHGRVRSVDRIVQRSRSSPMRVKGTVLKPSANDTGHQWVNIGGTGGHPKRYIHRLVAMTFLGECPDGMEVRHRNGDPTDNRPENLTYGTRSENMYDKVRHGRHPFASRTHCPSGHELTWPNLEVMKWKR